MLLVIAILFFGLGYYIQMATANLAKTASPDLQVKQHSSVQEILQDNTLTDPEQQFTGFTTGMLIGHIKSGRVSNVSSKDFSIRNDKTIVSVPKTPTTAYFILIDINTRSLTTPQVLQIGDVATMIYLIDAQTQQLAYTIVYIDKQGALNKQLATIQPVT